MRMDSRREKRRLQASVPSWSTQLLYSIIILALILTALFSTLFWWDQKRSPVHFTDPELPVPGAHGDIAAPEVIVTEDVVVPVLPKVLPDAVPVPAPLLAPVVPLPVVAKADSDRDIIADLDMYENADLLRKLDVVADMAAAESVKETPP
ncbi:MAG: hypothetical protein HQL17_07805 [Candidatus Omnitrophica bacterium]|nr:hypothetical protein [Candidatus Omnitrophota bacterium]